MKLELIIGSARTVCFSIPNLPTGVTVSTALFMVKRRLFDDDGDALIYKVATSTASDMGRIVNSGPDAEVEFYLGSDDTAELDWRVGYVYAMKVLLSNGEPYSPDDARGPVTVHNYGVSMTTISPSLSADVMEANADFGAHTYEAQPL